MGENRVLLSLSGGIDSATVLSLLLRQGYQVTAVSFYYASKHNAYENEAARQLAKYYEISLLEIDIASVMQAFESNLLLTGEAVPEGHYEHESMKKTVVPARNLIFISIMAGIAISKNIPIIALGVHQGDHFIYPDCRPDFIESARKTVELASDGQCTIMTPILHDNKASVVRLGIFSQLPFHLTRTCYTEDEIACGKCGSCVERLEAFEKNGMTDPIPYQI